MSEENDRILQILLDFINGLENCCLQFKRSISELKGLEKPKLPEETFTCLKWQSEKGSRLGDYEVAYKRENVSDYWQHAFNILKQNNSVIGNPFHEEGYQFRYWIYPSKYEDRIFRKKLSEANCK